MARQSGLTAHTRSHLYVQKCLLEADEDFCQFLSVTAYVSMVNGSLDGLALAGG